MPLPLERKFKKVFELGHLVEDIFEAVCKINNIPVVKTSKRTDMRNRIDFYVKHDGVIQAVDVKARRRLSRCDFSRWGVFYEIRNGKGELNIYKKYTHLALEIAPAVFLVVPKKVMSSILKEALKEHEFELKRGYLGERAEYFKFYTRTGTDLMAVFPEDWFINKARTYEGVWEVYTDVSEGKISQLVQRELEIYKEIQKGCGRR
jgi:hypothetical protein